MQVLDFDPVEHAHEVKSPHADQEPSTAIEYCNKSLLSMKYMKCEVTITTNEIVLKY